MRIGFFLDSYRPYISGVVHSVDSFASGLRGLGHEVYIIAPGAPGAPEDEFLVKATSFHTAFQPKEHYLPYPVSLALKRKVRNLNLDMIHTHHMFLLGRMGAAWARMWGIPLVHTYHTLLTEYVHYVPVAPGMARKSVMHMTKSYCNRCARVVVPTRQIEPILRSYGVRAPISVVPTGIDLTPYEGLDKASCRRELGYGPGDFVLVWLARLTKEKNPEFIIKAFAKLAAVKPQAKLLMAGGGPLEQELKGMVNSYGISERVKFTGTVKHSEVCRYYKAGDLFIFASLTDTQAITIPEAMAAGIPAVAVAAGGVPGMIRDGEDGFLTPLNPEAFNEAIIRVMDDPTLHERMAGEALLSAERLSSKASAMALFSVYQELYESCGSHDKR